jgi:hypothetical protein
MKDFVSGDCANLHVGSAYFFEGVVGSAVEEYNLTEVWGTRKEARRFMMVDCDYCFLAQPLNGTERAIPLPLSCQFPRPSSSSSPFLFL